MPRLARNIFDTPFFHVISQGVNKEYIFKNDKYINTYMSLLKRYKGEFNINIIAFCIMNNHAHLLLHTQNTQNMGKYMHKVHSVYAQYYNNEEHRVGVVFRNRYVSEPIFNEKYLAKCVNYIHMNPVKAGIVEESEDYKYSSSRYYNTSANFPVLSEIYGANYKRKVADYGIDHIFKDIDVDKKEIIKDGIKGFEKIKNKSYKELMFNKEEKRELIHYLHQEYKIKYIDMIRELGITKGEINSLK